MTGASRPTTTRCSRPHAGLDQREGRVEEGLPEIAVVVVPPGGNHFFCHKC
jgi:hypothetical protein